MYPLPSLNPNQKELLSFRPAGVWIPYQWMTHLTTDRGNPWPIAALVLAEIIYWSTPVQSLDENGEPVYFKRHRGELFQPNYQQIGDHWDISKRTVRRVVDYLVAKGLVFREHKTVRMNNGQIKTNVPFVSPIVSEIKAITYGAEPNLGLMRPSSDHENPGHVRPTYKKTTKDTNDNPKDSRPTAGPQSAGTEISEISEPESDHQRTLRMYQDALGYKIPNGARSAAGVRRMLKAGYTPEQIIGCYHWLKEQKFWNDKPVSTQTIHSNIGEFVKMGSPSHNGNGPQLNTEEVNKRALAKLEKLGG